MACSVGGRLRDMEVHRGIEHVFEGLVSKLAKPWLFHPHYVSQMAFLNKIAEEGR